jgi:hypothetical protein
MYNYNDQVKEDNVGRVYSTQVERQFGGIPEGKRPLEIPRPRCEGNIQIDLRAIG